MKRLKLIYTATLFFLLIAIVSCSTGGRKIVWKNPTHIATHEYEIFHELTLNEIQKRNLINKIHRIHSEVKSYYSFNYNSKRKIGFIIFKNRQSYQTYSSARFSILTEAHFMRNSGEIFIPIDAPDYVWRHEISHAVLESYRPNLPYWFQEGLAFFIQNNPGNEKLSCTAPGFATMPNALQNFLPGLRNLNTQEIKRHFQLKDSQSLLMHDPALAGYFIFYLWKEKKLLSLIQSNSNSIIYENPEIILAGDDLQSWDIFLNKFHIWLNSNEQLLNICGC